MRKFVVYLQSGYIEPNTNTEYANNEATAQQNSDNLQNGNGTGPQTSAYLPNPLGNIYDDTKGSLGEHSVSGDSGVKGTGQHKIANACLKSQKLAPRSNDGFNKTSDNGSSRAPSNASRLAQENV